MRRRLVPVNTTTVIVMDTWQAEGGHARYAYRLRVSTLTEKALMKEWGRCRWVWNQCVAESKRAYRLYRETGEKQTVGPAQLDKMLTGWRAEHSWLRKGASVPQQQVIRDFGKSRAKALTDIKDRIPQHRRAGMPRFKKKAMPHPRWPTPSEASRSAMAFCASSVGWTCTWCGPATSRRSRVRCGCIATISGTGTPHSACGFTAPRDKNSALVVRNRAGFNPGSAEDVGPGRAQYAQAV